MLVHELSIAESIVETVLSRTGDRRVHVVRVQVGRLMAVVPDALLFCFDLAAEGTPLAGARLEVEQSETRVHCRTCEQETLLPDMILLCDCGSADVQVVTGRELQVSSVEVV